MRNLNRIFLLLLFCAIVCSGSRSAALCMDDDAPKGPRIHVVPKNKPVPELPPSAVPQEQTPPATPREQQPTTQPASPPVSRPTGGTQPARPATTNPSQPATRPQASTPQAQNGPSNQQPNLADQVVTHKLGTEHVRAMLQGLQDNHCQGSSGCSTLFDGGIPASPVDSVVKPNGGTPFFQGPAPNVIHEYKKTSAADAQNIIKTYGDIPGGVTIEGAADGLGPISDLTYDSRYNAFILDDRGVYLNRVRRREVALLCRALAQDEKLGVSLSTRAKVYGSLSPGSDLVWSMLLADQFLGGNIAFAHKDWTTGYRFAGGYQPQDVHSDTDLAVFFRFYGFQFQVQQQEYQVTQEGFEARTIPLTGVRGQDGGLLPDDAALDSGKVPPAFENNVRHIADNINYYRRERLVERVFAIGEAAAFIRGLKKAGVDLAALADAIDAELATWEPERKPQ